MATNFTSPPFVEAPFYGLVDLRGEGGTLLRFFAASRHPTTGKVRLDDPRKVPPTDVDIAISKAQNRRLRELDPSVGDNEYLFYRREFPMEQDLMEKSRGLSGKKPKTISDFEHVYGMVNPPRGEHTIPVYTFVSQKWKDAIEAVELGVHDFYPFTLNFMRGGASETHDGFVLRCRTFVRHVEPSYFNTYAFPVVGHKDSSGQYVTATFQKDEVEGRHWFETMLHPRLPFISLALAQRLIPLLPDDVYLVPAAVA